MKRYKVYNLIVEEKNNIVGILTMHDILEANVLIAPILEGVNSVISMTYSWLCYPKPKHEIFYILINSNHHIDLG